MKTEDLAKYAIRFSERGVGSIDDMLAKIRWLSEEYPGAENESLLIAYLEESKNVNMSRFEKSAIALLTAFKPKQAPPPKPAPKPAAKPTQKPKTFGGQGGFR